MEWWQPVSMVGSVAVMMTAMATLGWRVLERMRIENQTAHDKIGESIAKLRDDLTEDMNGHVSRLSGDTAKLEEELGGKIAELRRELGGEIAEVRKELGGKIAKVRKNLDGHISRTNDEFARVRRDLGGEIAEARRDLGGEIAEARRDLGGEITRAREDLGGEIARVREGVAEVRGELRGVNRSLQDLKEDFRVHVYGGTASA